MKIARLPNGKTMQFPADMHDDEVDRAVKALMGVKSQQEIDNETKDNEIRSQTLKMMGSIAQSINSMVKATIENTQRTTELTKKVEAMTKVIEKTDERNANTMVHTMQALRALSGQVGKLTETIATSSKSIVDAHSAPKVLVKSDDNKSATIQVKGKE